MAKKRKTKKEPVLPAESWHCETCGADIVLGVDRKPVIDHLLEAHGIDAKTVKASNKMLMALDGADFYQNTIQWTWPAAVGPVVMVQTKSGPRSKAWGG